MKSNKKAGFMETTLGKVVFGLIVVVIVLAIIWLFSGKLSEVWAAFARKFRFGG